MNVVIPISIIAFLLSVLTSTGKLKDGLKYCFVLLTIVGAIHYDYGNDYETYLNMFYESESVSFSWKSLTDYFRDPGWTALCKLFKPFGFFGMVFFLNMLQNFVYYRIIKKYVPVQWQWLSVFIYVFSTSFYLLNFSMMRQGLAIALLFQALFLIIEKRYAIAVILIVVASLVHGTSMLAIPFLFAVLYIKNSRNLLLAYSALFIIIMFFYNSVFSLLSGVTFNDTLSEYYDMYRTGRGIEMGIGFAVDIVTIITLVYVALVKKKSTPMETRLLTYLMVCYLVIPFQMRNQMIGRIGYYFLVSSIVAVPLIYRYLDKVWRVPLLSIYISITLYRYYLFFTVGAFAESYSKPFPTIFDVPWI